jgi:hypothetical protein
MRTNPENSHRDTRAHHIEQRKTNDERTQSFGSGMIHSRREAASINKQLTRAIALS